MLLLFHLSGEHPTLPLSELAFLGHPVSNGAQVATLECPDPSAATRLALTHRVLEHLGSCEATDQALARLLRNLSLTSPIPFAARVTRIAGASMNTPAPELERVMGRLISGPVSLSAPQREYRLLLTGDRCYLGKTLFLTHRGEYDKRNPGSREFFHPGVMMPRMARALVNISCLFPGDTLLDPFCGTGGILIEGNLLGALPVGGDSDLEMVNGSRKNIGENADLYRGDATSIPLRGASVDSVVTDLPYGQSVRITAGSMDRLYSGTFEEIGRVLRPGKRAVVVTNRDVLALAEPFLEIEELHSQRVHKSLTRWVLVARKR